MARPNRHTVEEVIDAIRNNHGLLAAAARELEIDRTTIYKYVKKYPTVAQALEESRETILDMAEGQLYKAVKNGSVPAMMFLLKTVGRNRGYAESINLEHSGAMVSTKINIFIPENGRNDRLNRY